MVLARERPKGFPLGVVLRAANQNTPLACGKRTKIYSWQKSLIFD
jgi:hypothetical protein